MFLMLDWINFHNYLIQKKKIYTNITFVDIAGFVKVADAMLAQGVV